MIRFGWIDEDDWKPQAASTGQMASLAEEVYTHKLIPLKGKYVLGAPIRLLDGIGEKSEIHLNSLGISSINDLLDPKHSKNNEISKFVEIAKKFKDKYSN